MQAVEFCYWMQGFFELGAGRVLTARQIEIIRAHVNLVKATVQRNQPPDAKALVGWLDGALDMIEADNEVHTDKIKGNLNRVFLHAIDPTQEAKPGMNLDAAHTGKPTFVGNPDPSKPVARC